MRCRPCARRVSAIKSPSDRNALEGRDDLATEQLDRLAHQVGRHAADGVVRAEDGVADALLALPELADDRVRAADEREAVGDVELVALGRHRDRLTPGFRVRKLAVAAHAPGMASPADP